MAEPVDILIVAEKVEIANACMAQVQVPWSEQRLAGGVRVFVTRIDKVQWALVAIDALPDDEAMERTNALARLFTPTVTVFLGNAFSRSTIGLGDIVLASGVSVRSNGNTPVASPGYSVPSVVLQDARYLDASDEWREATNAEIVSAGAEENDPRSTVKPGIVQSERALLAVVRRYALPRLLVLGVRGRFEINSVGRGDTTWLDDVRVAQRLALFTFLFIPDQLRAGNFQRSASPAPDSTAASEVDEDFAALMQEYVEDLRVTSISLTNFKNIGSLDLSLRDAPSAKGRWTCIAGVNGAGKSALLQAITIALLGDRLAVELGGDRLQRARRLVDGERLDASISLTTRSAQREISLGLGISESGLEATDPKRMGVVWKARARYHLVRAYGPGRNLSEHLDGRYSDRSADVQAVMTLFDPLTQVASAEALIDKSADEGFLGHLKDLADHVFQDLGLRAVTDGGALRFESQGAKLSVVDLPDGFRATLAWIADLALAWYRAASKEQRAEGVSSMRATVLIDEIDLHLHPKLQRTLVPRLREKLPRVQWIVTTHSPLVLACFDRREIVMLEPDAERGVRQREIDRQVMGFTLDEIVEWLMETPPRSLALDQVAKAEVDPDKRLALLLAMSPSVNEREAEEALSEEPPSREDDVERGEELAKGESA